MRPFVRRPGPLLALLMLLAALPLRGDEPRPSWECLPDDTAVMVRMPMPAAFLEALRTRTKFGAVALSEQRIQGIQAMLLDKFREDGATFDLEEFDKTLAKYDLRKDDLAAAFQGDLGAGFVTRRRGEGLPPLGMMLVWFEPGEEVASRLVTAAQRKAEEDIAADATGTTKRIDLTMAGHEVTCMVEPVMGIDPAGLDFGADNFDPADEAAVEKRLAEIQDRIHNAKLVKTGQTHAFLARLGGRLIIGQTLPGAAGANRREGDRDFDLESGTDEAREVFERFLAAHGEPGRSAVADALEGAGLAASLPAGMPLVDILIDPRVLLKAAGDEATESALESVGARNLGPVAWRQTLDGDCYRSGMFVSLPAPRTGLMRLLDQECDAAEVPSFVTSEAIDFTQISLDLGKAYEIAKEWYVARGGPDAAGMAGAVEMQAQGWLGVELPRLLSALGSHHWIVSYPPRVAEAFAEARRARGDDGGQQKARQIADRLAVVWRITDEGSFGRLLQRLAGMAGAGGDLQEEQGFRGFRMPDGPAVFLGQDHLVVGIGADSLEKTLTAIRNPPSGDASLRESRVPRRAAELLSLEPARMFGVSDSSRSAGSLGVLREMLRALEPEDVEEPYRNLLAAAQKLLPTDDDMEGMFGVGATTLRAGADGVSLQTAWEMPAP